MIGTPMAARALRVITTLANLHHGVTISQTRASQRKGRRRLHARAASLRSAATTACEPRQGRRPPDRKVQNELDHHIYAIAQGRRLHVTLQVSARVLEKR